MSQQPIISVPLPYHCRRCGYQATNKSRYVYHLKKKWPCLMTHSTLSREDLLREIATKTKNPQTGKFECKYCKKAYASSNSKYKHQVKCATRHQDKVEQAQHIAEYLENKHQQRIDTLTQTHQAHLQELKLTQNRILTDCQQTYKKAYREVIRQNEELRAKLSAATLFIEEIKVYSKTVKDQAESEIDRLKATNVHLLDELSHLKSSMAPLRHVSEQSTHVFECIEDMIRPSLVNIGGWKFTMDKEGNLTID